MAMATPARTTMAARTTVKQRGRRRRSRRQRGTRVAPAAAFWGAGFLALCYAVGGGTQPSTSPSPSDYYESFHLAGDASQSSLGRSSSSEDGFLFRSAAKTAATPAAVNGSPAAAADAADDAEEDNATADGIYFSEALERHFEAVFGGGGGGGGSGGRRGNNKKQQQQRGRRRLEDNNNNNNNNNNYDNYYSADDEVYDDDGNANYNNNNNNANNNNANNAAANDDIYGSRNEADERCSEFLVSFLEGATDAHDTCEGLMNAYTAAGCSDETQYYSARYDFDDYFEEFAGHECCQALMYHHKEYCEVDKLLTNVHLLLAAGILLFCEFAKAIVCRLNIHFLPEAAVCILVGTAIGFLAHFLPFANLDDISFDDELFLAVLLPPIIFEAALSVSKYELKRRRGAILMFSVFGTIISTFSTGLMVHYISKASSATTFPVLDSLTFGALISSIDPVAILSVLTSLHMDQKDTIFILVFGESLLNDGIAITVFQTLVDRFDGKTNDGTTSAEEIFEALATFLISMFGSIAIGVVCGGCAWVYFYFLDRNLPPVMEVGSFFLWAMVPYYIADAIHLSGIVTIVAVGFFMDIYIAGPKGGPKKDDGHTPASQQPQDYVDMDSPPHLATKSFDTEQHSVAPFPTTERLHLSATADRHVRFVAHLTSQLAENAIFAYLGLFLFSTNYDWDPTLITIAITSCVLSRALMVVVVSHVVYGIYMCRGQAGDSVSNSSRTAIAIRNPRTQAVLVLAGLRGAVSLALVENVPIYNQGTGEGCEFKQVMKGMTSASIIFTTFIFGGGAYYILPHLGISPDKSYPPHPDDIVIEAPALTRPENKLEDCPDCPSFKPPEYPVV